MKLARVSLVFAFVVVLVVLCAGVGFWWRGGGPVKKASLFDGTVEEATRKIEARLPRGTPFDVARLDLMGYGFTVNEEADGSLYAVMRDPDRSQAARRRFVVVCRFDAEMMLTDLTVEEVRPGVPSTP